MRPCPSGCGANLSGRGKGHCTRCAKLNDSNKASPFSRHAAHNKTKRKNGKNSEYRKPNAKRKKVKGAAHGIGGGGSGGGGSGGSGGGGAHDDLPPPLPP